jgi:hypothetical protein
MSLSSVVPHRPRDEPNLETHTVRVSRRLWQDMLRAVDINRENISHVTRRDYEAYVERTKREHPDEWEQE